MDTMTVTVTATDDGDCVTGEMEVKLPVAAFGHHQVKVARWSNCHSLGEGTTTDLPFNNGARVTRLSQCKTIGDTIQNLSFHRR